MQVIKARNAQQALPEALYQMQQFGEKRESRNGPVLKIPEPVTIVYQRPTERVIFWDERDANPFFHLAEALWMLAGRNDVAFLESLVPRMSEFSDNGVTFNGAYGYRWRQHFGSDQIATICQALTTNPDCRRQVMAIWDGHQDLGLQSKDLPCNTQVYFSRDENGRLDMMVMNRSNDLVWGALGANVVHFSVLQEFMAAWIGCEVGVYRQVTNNLHLYLEKHAELMETLSPAAFPSQGYKACDPYEAGEVAPHPLVNRSIANWHRDLEMFLDADGAVGMQDRFFRRAARPVLSAYRQFKSLGEPDRYQHALETLSECAATDWNRACAEWIGRRWTRYKKRKRLETKQEETTETR